MPNFDGNPGEDPLAHKTTYHLWCYYNSVMDDSIRLCILKKSLTSDISKWYVDLECIAYKNFMSLTQDFANHYQFPIRCETRINILTNVH